MTVLLAEGGSPMTTLIMFGMIVLVMYFFMIRPQLKKQREQKKFRESLGKGTKVVTIGGIHGKVDEVKDNVVIIEVGGGVKLKIEKAAISMDYSATLEQQKN